MFMAWKINIVKVARLKHKQSTYSIKTSMSSPCNYKKS